MTVEAAYHVPYNRFVAVFAESAKQISAEARSVHGTVSGRRFYAAGNRSRCMCTERAEAELTMEGIHDGAAKFIDSKGPGKGI